MIHHPIHYTFEDLKTLFKEEASFINTTALLDFEEALFFLNFLFKKIINKFIFLLFLLIIIFFFNYIIYIFFFFKLLEFNFRISKHAEKLIKIKLQKKIIFEKMSLNYFFQNHQKKIKE
jgi:hypothetical protein